MLVPLHTYSKLYFHLFLVYSFEQYTRVRKIAKATWDMNKNLEDTVAV